MKYSCYLFGYYNFKSRIFQMNNICFFKLFHEKPSTPIHDRSTILRDSLQIQICLVTFECDVYVKIILWDIFLSLISYRLTNLIIKEQIKIGITSKVNQGRLKGYKIWVPSNYYIRFTPLMDFNAFSTKG